MQGGNFAGPEIDAILEDNFSFALRPYDWVMWAFPWGEALGPLADRRGPEGWQADALKTLQAALLAGPHNNESFRRYVGNAIQMAVKSGHDVGKTAFLSWLSLWALCTRENTRGRATANTEKQLRTIFWSELAKWHSMAIVGFLFEWTATSLYRRGEAGPNWRLDAITWSEHNLDSFSGLHNYGGRAFVIFDEASGIHEGIWERTAGIMSEANTELLWLVCSNPSKNTGRFYECFNRFAADWIGISVDSRSVPFTNKDKIAKEIEAWGIESDYIKVRWLGQFPSQSSAQLFATHVVEFARKRECQGFAHEPLVLGVDVARKGSNESVLLFRRGKDARTIPMRRLRGLETTELGDQVVSAMVEQHVDGVFVDEGGVGGGVVDFIRRLGHQCIGVNFGGRAASAPGGNFVFNKRAEMYVAAREWLREGGALEDSDDLQEQLLAIEFFFKGDRREIQLIPKEDLELDAGVSPDISDALALTFAYPVAKRHFGRHATRFATHDYDPFAAANEAA